VAPARKPTAAELAAARRARILNRGSDRMALVTGEIKRDAFEATVSVAAPASVAPVSDASVNPSASASDHTLPTAATQADTVPATLAQTKPVQSPDEVASPSDASKLDISPAASSSASVRASAASSASLPASSLHAESELTSRRTSSLQLGGCHTPLPSSSSPQPVELLSNVEAKLSQLHASTVRIRKLSQFLQLALLLLLGLYISLQNTPTTLMTFVLLFAFVELAVFGGRYILTSGTQHQIDDLTKRKAELRKSGVVSSFASEEGDSSMDLLNAIADLQSKFESSQFGQYAEKVSSFLTYFDKVYAVMVRFGFLLSVTVVTHAVLQK